MSSLEAVTAVVVKVVEMVVVGCGAGGVAGGMAASPAPAPANDDDDDDDDDAGGGSSSGNGGGVIFGRGSLYHCEIMHVFLRLLVAVVAGASCRANVSRQSVAEAFLRPLQSTHQVLIE